MARQPGWSLVLGLTLCLAGGCPGDDEDDDLADDDLADDDSGDDDSGDDDNGDDDSGDDDNGDDDTCDDYVHVGWPDWALVAVEDADASLVGAGGSSAGSELVATGDLDGDGLADLVVGDRDYANLSATHAGKVYVVAGRATGWAPSEPLEDHPAVIGELAECSIAHPRVVGDVSGDGRPDLVLDPEGVGPGGSCPGEQYLFHGRGGTWPAEQTPADADATLLDEVGGYAHEPDRTQPWLGDVDGDGIDDWLVSRPSSPDQRGHGLIVSGGGLPPQVELPDDALSWLYGEQGDELVFATAGDLNGDGLDDLLAYPTDGALSWDRFYLLFGRTSGFPTDAELPAVADVTFERSTENWPERYHTVGDIDGDGRDDLAIYLDGSYEDPQTGTVIFLGRPSWPATVGPDDADILLRDPGNKYHARAHAGPEVGDLNGDGIDELVMYASGDEPENSTDVYLFFGHGGSWPAVLEPGDADAHIRPEPLLDYYDYLRVLYEPFWDERSGVSGPQWRGDLDGDGLLDLILTIWDIGDPFQGLDAGGALFVFAGRPCWPEDLGTDEADAVFTGSVAFQELGDPGHTIVDDLDGDGRDDLVVSSLVHPVGQEAGEVFLFLGRDRGPFPSRREVDN